MATQTTGSVRPSKALTRSLLSAQTNNPADHSNTEAVYRLVRANGVGYAIAGFSRACLIRLIDYPEMPLRTNAREIVKAGQTALLVRTDFPVGGRMVSAAYKRVRRKTWLKQFTALLRTNRTLRTWRLGQAFCDRGIATARPLAVIIPKKNDVGAASFIVQEWIDGALGLHKFHKQLDELDTQRRDAKLKRAAESLGQVLGRMHSQNLSHRDLKPPNLLLVDHGRDVSAFVIDLDGADIHYRMSWRLRLRNLSRLVIGVEKLPRLPNSVRLRFLKQYLHALGDSSRDWKEVWRDLAAVSAERARKKQRRSQSAA